MKPSVYSALDNQFIHLTVKFIGHLKHPVYNFFIQFHLQ